MDVSCRSISCPICLHTNNLDTCSFVRSCGYVSEFTVKGKICHHREILGSTAEEDNGLGSADMVLEKDAVEALIKY